MIIYSGGQCGADIVGLKAAKDCGLETGGWMPLGWKTQDGPRPKYAELYNLKECNSSNYSVRTAMNVRDSDGTFIFTCEGHHKSPGTKCAKKYIKQFNKDHLHFEIDDLDDQAAFLLAKQFIWSKNINILNIAGNRNKEVEKPVYDFLCELFKGLKK